MNDDKYKARRERYKKRTDNTAQLREQRDTINELIKEKRDIEKSLRVATAKAAKELDTTKRKAGRMMLRYKKQADAQKQTYQRRIERQEQLYKKRIDDQAQMYQQRIDKLKARLDTKAEECQKLKAEIIDLKKKYGIKKHLLHKSKTQSIYAPPSYAEPIRVTITRGDITRTFNDCASAARFISGADHLNKVWQIQLRLTGRVKVIYGWNIKYLED